MTETQGKWQKIILDDSINKYSSQIVKYIKKKIKRQNNHIMHRDCVSEYAKNIYQLLLLYGCI